MASYTGRKTVLDLARELGIRTETVIHALQRLGVPESLQEINPALEQQLIEQMAADGAISAALSRGTKRRPAKDRVLANDEILLEALGAGEIGFSREEIPPAVRRLLDSLPKPSRFRRWWGRSHPLTTALVQNPLSPEEVEALFPAPLPPLDDPANATGPEAAASPSPPGGLVTDEGEIGISNLKMTADASTISPIEQHIPYVGIYTPRDGRDHLLYTLPETGLAVLRVIPAVRNKVNCTDLNGPSAQPKWLMGKGTIQFRLEVK